MSNLCKECGHSGSTLGAQGECPACGSYNYRRLAQVEREQAPPGKWRLVVLVGLWALLFVLIFWKLQS
jgi:transposase